MLEALLTLIPLDWLQPWPPLTEENLELTVKDLIELREELIK
jgi:hypothetical protein